VPSYSEQDWNQHPPITAVLISGHSINDPVSATLSFLVNIPQPISENWRMFLLSVTLQGGVMRIWDVCPQTDEYWLPMQYEKRSSLTHRILQRSKEAKYHWSTSTAKYIYILRSKNHPVYVFGTTFLVQFNLCEACLVRLHQCLLQVKGYEYVSILFLIYSSIYDAHHLQSNIWGCWIKCKCCGMNPSSTNWFTTR
jgi:hypothetical protein